MRVCENNAEVVQENTLEAMIAEHSRMHFYLNWAKERIDEMDAVLASLEIKAGQEEAR